MKDFIDWHSKKSKLDLIKQRPHFHEGEIWYVSLGLNVGYEQDGKGDNYLRPILIIRKFNNEICWIVPLTHTLKNTIHYAHIKVLENESVAILSQLKLLDAKRFSHIICKISNEDFKLVTKKLKDLIP